MNKKGIFILSDEVMKEMNIPLIEKIDSHEEMWGYVILDRHPECTLAKKYMISTYGRVYSCARNKMVAISRNDRSVSSNGHYERVTLQVSKNRSAHYFVHRLVALRFLKSDPERIFVNHIDGIPYHNYVWNLEWTTASENSRHAHMMGLRYKAKGQERYNAVWTDDEVHVVCAMIEDGYKATYIYNELSKIYNDQKMTYERVKALCKHIKKGTHWKHIACEYNIKYTKKRKNKMSMKK